MARLLAETPWGCNGLRRKTALSLFAVVLGIAASGCSRPAAPAAVAAPPEQSKPSIESKQTVSPRPELVEVWVAARDLPVGTVLTRDDLPKLAIKKKLPKDALPPVYVANLEEFIDKPLTRLAYKDATFDPHSFSKQAVVRLPEGLDLVSLSVKGDSPVAGFVVPGSRVDVRAKLNHTSGSATFTLLKDVQVLAVDSVTTQPQSHSVSLAANQEQALLLALAKQRDCELEIQLRPPGKQDDSGYGIKKVTALLQDDQKLATLFKAVADRLPTSPPSPGTSAPPPEELIEVWVAVSDVPPKAVITPQLVNTKLKQVRVPKDAAGGAIRDLTELLDQEWMLESGLRQGQLLTASRVGPPQPAAKAEPEPLEVAPMPRAVKPKKYKDVTITTSSGAKIYRYEEVAPDKFKFVGEFAPDSTRNGPVRAAAPPKKGN
jgi:Flp pilus assembly protein CpaB